MNGVLSGCWNNLKEYERCLQEELNQINLSHQGRQLSLLDLDIKFCQLRTDLPVAVQLFENLTVNETKTIVSLVGTLDDARKKTKKSRSQRKRANQQSAAEDSVARYTEEIFSKGLETQQPAVHLSPREWDERLTQLQEESSQQQDSNAIFLDCRNVYESSVGFFRATKVDTVLTNTRKYSELPQVLVEHADRLARSEHIFMYCTGGVRCERASIFLQSLLVEKSDRKHHIYQLQGGIQRYLEADSSDRSFFKGKNFVFDPRRTDPVHNNYVVGQCLVCKLFCL